MKTPFLRLACGAAALLLAGCADAPATDGIHDPLESFNRAIHASNKASDRNLVRPAAQAYGTVVPEPVRKGVSNLADVAELPGDIVNGLLQGDVDAAGTNLVRLAVNVTFGLGGVIDFADAAGIPENKTDFGETLAVWGVGEGPYLELPVIGPSTLRDAVGTAVDLAFDPVTAGLGDDERAAVFLVKLLSRLNDRYRYSSTIDSVLYESADSYAQARLLYLQNRRFALGKAGAVGGAAGGESADDSFIDPYEDPYGP